MKIKMKVNDLIFILIFGLLSPNTYAVPVSPVLSSNHQDDVESVAKKHQSQLKQLVQNQEHQTQDLVQQQHTQIESLLQQQQQEDLALLNDDVEDNFDQALTEIQQFNDDIEQVAQTAQVQGTQQVLDQIQQYNGDIEKVQDTDPSPDEPTEIEVANVDTTGDNAGNYGDSEMILDGKDGNVEDKNSNLLDDPLNDGYGNEDIDELPYENESENEIESVDVGVGKDKSSSGGWFKSIGNAWDKFSDKVVDKGHKLGDQIGASLDTVYRYFQSEVPGIWERIAATAERFGLLIQKGSRCFVERVALVFDEVKGLDVVGRLEKHLNEGNEEVDRFLQKIGEKLTAWEKENDHKNVDPGLLQTGQSPNHHVDPHYSDIFQDQEIKKELSKMVEAGILLQEEVDILSGEEIQPDRETVYKAIHFPKEDYSQKIRYPIKPINNPGPQRHQTHYGD